MKKKQGANCEYCVNYSYDDDYECYTCEVNLDEDEITKTALLDAYVKVLRQEKAVLPKNGESPFEKSRNACDVSESVKEEIIKDYLFSLRENAPKLMGGGGEIPVTPPVRPKTLAEAGRLAQNIIKLR